MWGTLRLPGDEHVRSTRFTLSLLQLLLLVLIVLAVNSADRACAVADSQIARLGGAMRDGWRKKRSERRDQTEEHNN